MGIGGRKEEDATLERNAKLEGAQRNGERREATWKEGASEKSEEGEKQKTTGGRPKCGQGNRNVGCF